ncbi:uncharacterized protein LOC127844567 isoform X2 [Dreissena polymorpha]|uniref:uncharacterized protein LOC127844567 isoform X2 n=1 Tax=Dreissena polymorpha TaxID=45954 RepID=UPI00226540EC|nr:uncharacterized protein LOC127844567 isoform X2 [Dreissena polymorpha]
MFSEELLRSLQPASVLPVTRNMPYTSASVPSRNQPRNMTGIYLGLEGNINPPPNKGMGSVKVRKGTSSKTRTTSEDRRYKIVEALRIKEDCRGFRGNPLKGPDNFLKKVPASTPTNDEENAPPRQQQYRKWGPAKSADPKHFEDVIRQNPRHFTSIINNGVTRSENLTGMMSFAEQYGWDLTNTPLTDTIIDEVQKMTSIRDDLTGLEECFKKVCKGNPDSLHSLLPLRKAIARPGSYTTGFTVRSYRNPNQAEILANFEVTGGHKRPKTVPANLGFQRQPLVPAPYFFKHFNKPMTAGSSKKHASPGSQFDETLNMNGEKIVGVAGSGAVSRSLRVAGPRSTTAWSEDDAVRIRRIQVSLHGTPRNDTPLKDSDRSHNVSSPRHVNSVTVGGPLELRAEGYQVGTGEDRNRNQPAHNTEATVNQSGPSTGRSARITTNSPVMDAPQKGVVGNGMIRLDLETEDGKKQEIYIDDADSACDLEKLKESEARVASLQEDAKQRKRELEQILVEHQEIVKKIVRQTSHEDGHDTFQSASEESRHQ